MNELTILDEEVTVDNVDERVDALVSIRDKFNERWQLAVGKCLLLKKQELNHGQFETYCQMKLEANANTCRSWMNAAAALLESEARFRSKRSQNDHFDQKRALTISELAAITVQKKKEHDAREAQHEADRRAARVEAAAKAAETAKKKLADRESKRNQIEAAQKEAKLQEELRMQREALKEAAKREEIANELRQKIKAEVIEEESKKAIEDNPAIIEQLKKQMRDEAMRQAKESNPDLFDGLDEILRHVTINKGGVILETIKQILQHKNPIGRSMLKKCLSSMFHPDQGKVRKDGDLLAKLNDEFTKLELSK